MAEIKGISYGDDSTKFISTNGGMIEGNFVVGGNLAVEGNLSSTEPEPEFKIVSFMDGIDDELAAMINAHYNDEIDIRDYWHVGDTRTLHLYATSGSENNSAAHAEQDMTIVIVAFNHDNLVEPINGHTTAAVSIACREVLGYNGKAEQE